MTTSLFPNRPYRVAIVGAGSGIGRAAAEHLTQAGVTVVCMDRDDTTTAETVAAIAKSGGEATSIHCDVTDDKSVIAAAQSIESKHGQLHGLVNCAGITGKTNIKPHEVDLDDFDTVYRINLRGAMILTKAFAPGMLKHNYGRILHIASIAGKDGNAGMAAYSATKAGLIGLVKSMGKDYAETGVTINALAPAVILTPMVEKLPQATVDYMVEKIPMKRLGQLEEVAAMIAWIVSPAASFTTAFTFDLSGGRAVY
jgi:3-oxoacyl-[acyl-carrier protein] reductase